MNGSTDVANGSMTTDLHERPSQVVLGPAGALRGRLVGWSADGQPLVTLCGEPSAPVPAATCVDLHAMDASATDVILVLEHGDERRPIIIGLVRSPSVPVEEPSPPAVSPLAAEVRIDGRTTKVTAHKELVLTCGKASITLRADGRITIRGAQVTSEAQGVNRLRGGSIELN